MISRNGQVTKIHGFFHVDSNVAILCPLSISISSLRTSFGHPSDLGFAGVRLVTMRSPSQTPWSISLMEELASSPPLPASSQRCPCKTVVTGGNDQLFAPPKNIKKPLYLIRSTSQLLVILPCESNICGRFPPLPV